MGQEHSLPKGDRDPEVEEYLDGLRRNVREAKRILGAPLHEPKRCGHCGRPIFWGQTKSGQSLMVDAEPVEGGHVQLYDRNGSIVLVVYPVPPPGTKLRHIHLCKEKP